MSKYNTYEEYENFQDALSDNYFSSNHYPYPNKEDFTSKVTCNQGCEHIIIDEKGYLEARKEYENEQGKKYKEFQENVLKEVGLSGHPKKDKIYEYAWSKGHASGYYEVYYILAELSYIFLKT